ncbi:MAG: hypothetical protein JWO26_2928 [Rhodospirillales bacterium]|jgi:predicted tellurium resistance membrane protein TerC|nr:hypothetical protein [Rhodospirillales bacterium]MDB5383296.1 hypothetical protein [Rhodospirillales bacterium]
MNDILPLLSDPSAWAALAMLTIMEVVLGIDNLIFITILTNKLPENQRANARRIGIGAALLLRLGLVALVFVIVQLSEPVFMAFGQGFSWRDLILVGGGLFLVWKATKEIHHNVDPDPGPDVFNGGTAAMANVGAVIGQILLLDLVFSVDSIITAVGMTPHIPIIIAAMIITVAVMLIAATPLANFVHANPSVVILMLGFLMMIGMVLIAEGFGAHVPKGYLYAAMAFSAVVEALNLMARRARRKRSPVPAPTAEPRMPVQR